MARFEGPALAPWGVLGGGKIRTDAEEAHRREGGEKGRTAFSLNWERTPAEKKGCDTLEEMAKEVGTGSITACTSGFFFSSAFQRFPSLLVPELTTWKRS
jgi:hypothetical protein